MSEEDKKFVSEYNKTLHILAIIGSVTFTAVVFFIYYGIIDLTPKDVVLVTFEQRISFTLKYLSLQLLWIVIMMYAVILKRVDTPALDPMNGWEDHVQMAKNILTNSIEQSVVFSFSLLILAIELDPVMLGRMVPGLTMLFMVGRIVFWLGYPRYRGFGFSLCNFPIILTVTLNLYSLYKLYF